MSQWELLGIQPTRDARTIRRAYAERSKACHPEDDPEGFRLLYAAYQWALERSKKTTRYSGGEKTSPGAEKEAEPPRPVVREVDHRPRGAQGKAEPDWKNGKAYDDRRPPLRRRSGGGPRRPQQARPHSEAAPQPEFDYDAIFAEAAAERQKQLEAYRRTAPAQKFVALFDGPDQGKQDQWEAYFTSDAFLAAQFEPEYLEFLLQSLKDCGKPVKQLPYAFSVELYMSYGLGAYTQGNDPPELLRPLCELLRPLRQSDAFQRSYARKEHAPRAESFLVYNRLAAQYRASRQGGVPLSEWEAALRGAAEPEVGPRRDPSLFLLLAFFVRSHPDLPREVCVLLYRTFDFTGYARSSLKQPARPLYEALRDRLGAGIDQELRLAEKGALLLRRVQAAYGALYAPKYGDPEAREVDAFFSSQDFLEVERDERWLDFLRTLYLTEPGGSRVLRRATYEHYRGARSSARMEQLQNLLRQGLEQAPNG